MLLSLDHVSELRLIFNPRGVDAEFLHHLAKLSIKGVPDQLQCNVKVVCKSY